MRGLFGSLYNIRLIVPIIDSIYQTLWHCQIFAEGTTGFCYLVRTT
jgi:hypothetical protein